MKKNKINLLIPFVKIIIILVVMYIVFTYIFGLYIVTSINYNSININPHDFLIYYRLEKNYQNNDIVFYKNKVYRIIGTKGQIINKKGNKVLIDNDVLNSEIKYDFKYPYTINEGELFIINNEDGSTNFGCIDSNSIEGKLIFKMQIRNF